jgi:hypothetical protein
MSHSEPTHHASKDSGAILPAVVMSILAVVWGAYTVILLYGMIRMPPPTMG